MWCNIDWVDLDVKCDVDSVDLDAKCDVDWVDMDAVKGWRTIENVMLTELIWKQWRVSFGKF